MAGWSPVAELEAVVMADPQRLIDGTVALATAFGGLRPHLPAWGHFPAPHAAHVHRPFAMIGKRETAGLQSLW